MTPEQRHARPEIRDRHGIALFAAVTAVILVSLAAVGLFHLSLADARRSRDSAFTLQAATAADGGALALMRDWNLAPWDTLLVGDTLPAQTYPFDSAHATVRATRIASLVWHVVSAGQSGDSSARTLARRNVNALFRLAVPDVAVDAALTARDSVRLTGTARVVGTDTAAGSWAIGCSAGTPGAAVASPDTTRTCDGTCASHSGIRAVGAPPLMEDSTALNPSRYVSFGAESWASLTAHASVVIPAGSVVTPAPVVQGGVCDRTATDNWGDPSALTACWSYSPLVWAQGDLEMRGGTGQGVLLVDGDFTLSQGAQFHGVAITSDDLIGGAGGGQLIGLAMAADTRGGPGDHTTLGDGVQVQLSRCAVEGALRRSARLVPVVRRWWAAVR